jgi:hypothetical protein
MTTKIDEIVTKEALEQCDLMIAKLKEATRLQKKLGDNVSLKVQALSDLVSNGMLVNADVIQLANEKLKELIPLL